MFVCVCMCVCVCVCLCVWLFVYSVAETNLPINFKLEHTVAEDQAEGHNKILLHFAQYKWLSLSFCEIISCD